MKKRKYFLELFLGFLCLAVLILPTMPTNSNEEPVKSEASGSWLDYGNHGTSLEGSGTASDPFLIKSGYDLATVAYNVNNGIGVYHNCHYSIVNDIDLSAHYWTAIGNDDRIFMSSIEGNMHFIKGLIMNNPNDVHCAFIGRAYAGTFNNIILDSPYITSYGEMVAGFVGDSSVIHANNIIIRNLRIVAKNPTYIGGLTGWSSGFFENIYVSGSISFNSDINKTVRVGGIAGLYVGEGMKYAISEVNVFGSSGNYTSYVGGIIGASGHSIDYATGVINKCINFGNVKTYSNVGIAGGISPRNYLFDSVYSYAEVYGYTMTYGLCDNTSGNKACYYLKNSPSNLSSADATYRKSSVDEYKKTNLDPEFFDTSENVNNGLPYLKWYYWQAQVDNFVNYHSL